MKNKVDNSIISNKYKELSNAYEKLGLNLSQALELLLKEANIPFLSINYRIKEADSFLGKIERKKYESPFEEIEDICGVRVICYYQSDVEKIKHILKKELDVLENDNKEESLEFDQFGYRSMHFIVKIKKEWLSAPNYRGLENLKAEVQVRTVLMHAWAEIEHKLAYKSKSQIPTKYRRKLSLISAKLEESDEQFEDIKNQIEQKKNDLIESAKESKKFDTNVEFNLDSLQAFLDFAFPEREKDISATRELFEDMDKNNIPLKTLTDGYSKVKTTIDEIEKEVKIIEKVETETPYFFQTGAAKAVLFLVDDNYAKRNSDHTFKDIYNKYKEILNQSPL